jgi:hypothetical protein
MKMMHEYEIKNTYIYVFINTVNYSLKIGFSGLFLCLIAQFLISHSTTTLSQTILAMLLPSTKPQSSQRNHLGKTLCPRGEL